MNQIATQDRDAISTIRNGLIQLDPEFKMALPSHIPVERFRRVAVTAVQRNPELVLADRKSLFGACMAAAQDGLLPDGREAALVVFKTKVKVDGQEQWIQQVQYMPMVNGIRKRVYQSGEVAGLTAHAVFQNDEFDYAFGLDEYLAHKPCRSNRGPVSAAYAVVTHKNGTKEFDVMELEDIEKVRRVSRRPDSGPWRDWYDRMAIKSVIRRLCNGLPLSADLQDLMHRDDSFYDLESTQPARRVHSAPQTIETRLDAFALGAPVTCGDEAQDQHAGDPSIPDTKASPADAASADRPAPVQTEAASKIHPQHKDAYDRGWAAQKSGNPRQVPKVFRGASQTGAADAFLTGWDDAARNANENNRET